MFWSRWYDREQPYWGEAEFLTKLVFLKVKKGLSFLKMSQVRQHKICWTVHSWQTSLFMANQRKFLRQSKCWTVLTRPGKMGTCGYVLVTISLGLAAVNWGTEEEDREESTSPPFFLLYSCCMGVFTDLTSWFCHCVAKNLLKIFCLCWVVVLWGWDLVGSLSQ